MAGIGDTVVIKDNTLDLTDSSLGEEAGIKKKKKKKKDTSHWVLWKRRSGWYKSLKQADLI